MKKSYYLKYATVKNKEYVRELLDKDCDLTFSEHDSAYFGIYFSYTGLYADKLTITDNYMSFSQEWLDEENKNYATLINISFTEGKNRDKLSRYMYIKNFFKQLPSISILDDKCIEENV